MAKTLGRLLREKRESRYLSLPEAELATRIRAEHLRALEEERFDDLPGASYVEIYLREYARFLDLEPERLLASFHQQTRWPRFRQRLGQRMRRVRGSSILLLLLGLVVLALLVGLLVLWLRAAGQQPQPTPAIAILAGTWPGSA